MSERTEGDILDGKVPGVESITIAGRTFALREPSFARNRRLMRAFLAQEQAAKSGDEAAIFASLESCIDAVLDDFSDEIAEARAWIEENATQSEVMDLFFAAQQVVLAPFVTAAANRAPTPPQNRAQRRSRSTASS